MFAARNKKLVVRRFLTTLILTFSLREKELL
jgi:hypothetical protein